MPYPAAAVARLVAGYYNSSAYDAVANPGGLAADGHTANFPAALADMGATAAWIQEGLATLQSWNAFLLDGQVATLPLLMDEPALRNGDFTIWQRGLGPLAFGGGVGGWAYGPDGWAARRAGDVAGASMSRGVGEQSPYCARLQRTAGNASAAAITLIQSLDPDYAIQLRGQQLCWSARLRCGATIGPNHLIQIGLVWSSDAAAVRNDDGQYSSSGGASLVTVSPSTSFQDVAVSAAIPSDVAKIGVIARITPPAAAAGASDYIDLELAMLETGFARTTFRRRNPASELLLARRYYRVIGGQTFGVAVSAAAVQMPAASDQMYGAFSNILPLTTTPTIRRVAAGADVVGAASVLSVIKVVAGSDLLQINGFAGLTAGEAVYIVTPVIGALQSEID